MDYSENDTTERKELIDHSITEIIIVRHGETELNAFNKAQGQLDIDLNEVGRQQAAAVADRLSREPTISAVYSSDLKRARDTAVMIAIKCGELEVITDQNLRDRHLGILQGVVFDDFAKLNPKAYEAFKSSDQEIQGGGESRHQLHERCISSLQRICEKHRGQRVVVVTHGAVIESVYKKAVAEQECRHISNASVGIIQVSDGDMWSIKSWNDFSHLKGTGFL